MSSFLHSPLLLLLLLSLLISLSIHQTTAAVQLCGGSCGGQEIRFPFKLTSQPDRCGFPKFNLSCQNHQTILSLPNSGDFSVQNIDYASQIIWLNDPDFCIPKRLLNKFTLQNSPFQELFPQNFTFLNCSSENDAAAGVGPVARPVDCLSGENYTVVSVPTSFYGGGFETMLGCKEIGSVVAPVTWPVWSDPSLGIALVWKKPDCRSCERDGGNCEFKNDSGFEIGCSGGFGHGISKGVKYGLIFGLGLPFLCLLGVTLYLRERIMGLNAPNTPIPAGTTSSSVIQSPVKGLDGQIIESYPITVLGESRRLPKPENNICAICLGDYEAKETLRTIPDCNHFFHASCLDEWLRLKGTCPLCRNTPDV